MEAPFEKTVAPRAENDDQGSRASVVVVLGVPLTSILSVSSGSLASTTVTKHSFWRSIDWKLMLALLFPVTVESLDYTVVATAQSHIASVFNALQLESYIGTSYLLASTVFLPFFASISDIYGRHFALQLSLLFFLLGSALSTGAQNMEMLLAGRGIAGIGAAGLLIINRTAMSLEKSIDKDNLQQSALYLLYVIGFTVGPMIGGYLVEANFRWVFAINLPCTALGMLLCFVLLRDRYSMHESHDPKELQGETRFHTPNDLADTWFSKLALIDWIGTFLFISGGILILLALNWGPSDNWKSIRVIVNIALGAFLIGLFLIWETFLERRSTSSSSWSNYLNHSGHVQTGPTRRTFCVQPMIPLELFKSYAMCVVLYDSFISGIVVFVMFYFVSIFTTVVAEVPPAQAGFRLLYYSPGVGIGLSISICMIYLFKQPIYPIVFGAAVMTTGVGLIQMAIHRDIQPQVDGFIAIIGFSAGMMYNALMIRARFTWPNHIASTGAMMLFFTALGGTVGLAQCFTILNTKVNSYIHMHIRSLVATLSPSDLAKLVYILNNGGLTSVTRLDSLPSAVKKVIRDAFRDGVRWAFISLVPWLGVGTILSLFLSPVKNVGEEGGEKEEMDDASAEWEISG